MTHHLVSERQYGGLKRQFNPITFQNEFILDRYLNADQFLCRDLYGHHSCINAIEFSGDGELMFSGGDDGRILSWQFGQAIQKNVLPKSMNALHTSNVFCLATDYKGSIVYSSGNDQHLFAHNVETGQRLNRISTYSAVYGLALNANESNGGNTVYLASHERRILRFDTRSGRIQELPLKTAGQHYSVHIHPQQSDYILFSSASKGAVLIDIRNPREFVVRFRDGFARQNCNYSTFNQTGSQVLIQRPILPPALFDTLNGLLIAHLDASSYLNSSTIKSACFAGPEDEWIATGSDDYGVYLWQTPCHKNFSNRTSTFAQTSCKIKYVNEFSMRSDEKLNLNLFENKVCNLYIPKADRVLRSHRSVVNQVRYNAAYGVLATCGVEKMIKVWNPFNWKQKKQKSPSFEITPNVYTHTLDEPRLSQTDNSKSLKEYIDTMGNKLTRTDHGLLSEDSDMISFFRLLVGRDIEGANDSDYFTSPDCSSDEDSLVEETQRRRSRRNRRNNRIENQNDNPNENETKKPVRNPLPLFATANVLMKSVASSILSYAITSRQITLIRQNAKNHLKTTEANRNGNTNNSNNNNNHNVDLNVNNGNSSEQNENQADTDNNPDALNEDDLASDDNSDFSLDHFVLDLNSLANIVSELNSDRSIIDGEVSITREFLLYYGFLAEVTVKRGTRLDVSPVAPPGWPLERWLNRLKHRSRLELLVRIKRLKAIRLELMSLLRYLKGKLSKLITNAEKLMKERIRKPRYSDNLPLLFLVESGWENDVLALFEQLVWAHSHIVQWNHLSRQLQRLRPVRILRTNLLMPEDSNSDSFEVFIPLVGHMLRVLSENAFEPSMAGAQQVDLRTLRISHLKDAKRSISYLWRECWTRARCRKLMYLERWNLESDGSSSTSNLDGSNSSSSSSSSSSSTSSSSHSSSSHSSSSSSSVSPSPHVPHSSLLFQRRNDVSNNDENEADPNTNMDTQLHSTASNTSEHSSSDSFSTGQEATIEMILFVRKESID